MPRKQLLLHGQRRTYLLPRSITEDDGSGCRLVYICREPKDALVSFWHYNNRSAAAVLQVAGGQQAPLPTFEDAFELCCEGRSLFGPRWCHVLEFWEVLFVKYEELLQDPVGGLEKLAAFMGCAFSREEEETGVVREIVDLCSFDELKGSDANQNEYNTIGVAGGAFFRKGVVGDWENYMTPEMAARLDKIVEEAIQSSGLTFRSSM